MIPDPYFSNLPNIGDLSIDCVFVEYECPLLFVLKNKNNDLFICDCFNMKNIQEWVLTKINKNRLLDYVNNKISTRDVFSKSDNDVFLISWNYGFDKEKCEKIEKKNLNDDNLPPDNTFLDLNEDELEEILEYINNI